MTYVFTYEHFDTSEGRLVFIPKLNPYDYEIQQLILEAERNIGALARLGLKSHPLKPTILRNSLVRTAHFTTKIEQNKLDFKEVEQLYQNYKKNPLTIKQKAQLEVKNVFDTYEYLYRLEPNKDFSDMDEPVLKKIQHTLMKDLTGYPDGYRNISVALQDGDGHISYQPPPFNEVPRLMQAYFSWLYTSVTGFANPYETEKIDHEKKVHPLIISGITHHLIGYIHPFPDGNGRTARAFSTLVGLIHTDLATIKDAFSVEEFFDKRIEDYYDTLTTATQGNLKPFILFYLDCVNASLTKVLKELQRYDRIKHIRELLGKGHVRTMFELICRMEDGEVFHRQLFDDTLEASPSSIAKNIARLKDLGVIQSGSSRGEYIVCIAD
ncbi:Fic family protein [Paenibacillus arenilitoris]|uniref:Fic family protein n=1 Tax=Paenibacillus arenilitoris TaxID=2772299 RepID=A0A927CQ85_9BACL|nr:Fic family protein [Paenibacillus arenilitoris]MBD2870803.1 Fic family protein [Paenibacillus arenilitoris]